MPGVPAAVGTKGLPGAAIRTMELPGTVADAQGMQCAGGFPAMDTPLIGAAAERHRKSAPLIGTAA